MRSFLIPSEFRRDAFYCRPVAFFFVSSASGRVQNRGRRTIMDPKEAECGWNANGMSSCHERYFYCTIRRNVVEIEEFKSQQFSPSNNRQRV